LRTISVPATVLVSAASLPERPKLGSCFSATFVVVGSSRRAGGPLFFGPSLRRGEREREREGERRERPERSPRRCSLRSSSSSLSLGFRRRSERVSGDLLRGRAAGRSSSDERRRSRRWRGLRDRTCVLRASGWNERPDFTRRRPGEAGSADRRCLEERCPLPDDDREHVCECRSRSRLRDRGCERCMVWGWLIGLVKCEKAVQFVVCSFRATCCREWLR
jgi:hypothetical protein